VNYHYDIADVPGWAKSQEMQTAFPQLNSATAGSQQGHVTLVENGNQWQVTR
jgi:hypothetical protein